MTNIATQRGNYHGSLDGLRAIAFLLVFVHHLPQFPRYGLINSIGQYGWSGVDLFFVISAWLFFYLFGKEWDRAGKISTWKFYVRRVMRISPLLIAFVAGVLWFFPTGDVAAPFRAVSLVLFADNIVTAVTGIHSSQVPYSSHLWTLSLEFQIYLVIPAAFIGMKVLGKTRFALVLVGVLVYCVALRYLFVGLGITHPSVWVLPFLRPEPILAGIALATYRPQWHWGFSAVVALAGAAVFYTLPSPFGASKLGTMVVYPVGAIMFAALLDTALRSPILKAALSIRPLTFLGEISYGLYVFHLLAIYKAEEILTAFGRPRVADATEPELYAAYASHFLLAFALTVALATVGFYVLERPIERLKRRFTVVDGRS